MSETNDEDVTTVLEDTGISVNNGTEVVPPEHDSCSPLPEDVTKKSKKRLREVSVEASTAKDDQPETPIDIKEAEAPPKKNRLKSIDAGDSEEIQSRTTPPPSEAPLLSTSPPHDSKVRQIRKRVKDLSWKEAQRKKPEGATSDPDQQDEGPETVDALSEGKVDDDESSKSVSAKSDSEKEEVERVSGEKKAPLEDDLTNPPLKTSTGSPSHVPSTPSPEPAVAEPEPSPSDVEEKHSGAKAADHSISRVSPDPDPCPGKRRRDDGDQNPREPKRISPPPEQEKLDKPPPVKSTGFLGYASATSPFAVSGSSTNVFGSTNPTPTFGSPSMPKPPTSSSFHPTTTAFNSMAPLSTYAPAAATFGASGFNAYASTASPFATTKSLAPSGFRVASSASMSPSRAERSKSPGRHANAFGPYTSRSGKFAATPSRSPKKPRRGSDTNGLDANDGGACSGSGSGSADEAGDEDAGGPTSFGDILSAKENQPDFVAEEDKKIEYTEQEVLTGEEDERTVYQVRAKLFAMAPPPINGWKERGVGTLKLNIHKKTGRARLVLRTDGVLRLVLNTSLFKGMEFELAQDPRYVKFGLIVDKKIVLHTLRLSSVKNAEELLDQVKAHTPGSLRTDSAGEV